MLSTGQGRRHGAKVAISFLVRMKEVFFPSFEGMGWDIAKR